MNRSHQRQPTPDPRPCGYCGRMFQPTRAGNTFCHGCKTHAYNDRQALRRNVFEAAQRASWVRCVRDDPGGLYRAGQDYWLALVRQDCCAGLASRESFRWEAAS